MTIHAVKHSHQDEANSGAGCEPVTQSYHDFCRYRGEDDAIETPQKETPLHPAPADDRFPKQEADPEKTGLRTLGEGPSAPGAAGEAAEAEAEQDDEDKDVPPGTKGWLNLLGAVVVNMLCYGMTNSFGVFQEYYLTHQLADQTPTAVSWIGSIQLCFCPLLGCISGPLFDAGYLKTLIFIGGSLYVFCMMMTSIATEYYQFVLAHGIGVGLGMGLIFSPSVSTLSHHFAKSRYRTLAYGCQASGSAIAGVTIPIMLRYLFPAIGFGWGMRILGFIVLLFVIVAFFTLSRTHPPRKKIAVLSPTVFRNPAYTLYVCGAGLISLAIYCPLTFGVTYATANGFSPSLANYALAICNGCSIIGRIVPLIAAQKFGPINTLITFSFTSAIMLFVWTQSSGVAGILTFDAFYGISSGAYAAALNPGAASFAPTPNQSGLYLGMCFFLTAFFWLAGTPATAALIRGNNYFAASMFCAAVVLAGCSLAVLSRHLWVKRIGTRWV